MWRTFAPYLLFLVGLALGEPVIAAEHVVLSHVPPPAAIDGPMQLRIPAARVARARVLVAIPGGYRVLPMVLEGGEFVASVAFNSLALLRYQFQLEMDGAFVESDFFEIRQPSDPTLEDEIARLDKEMVSLSAQRTQLENTVHALQRVDPATLTKRKNQEMAKALLALSQAERELASLQPAPEAQGGNP